MRPNDLAKILEINGKSLRNYLRTNHTRASEEKGRNWHLTHEQIIAATEHYGKKKEDVGYCSTIAEMYEEKNEKVEPFILGINLIKDLELPSNPFKKSWVSFNVGLSGEDLHLAEKNETWENTLLDPDLSIQELEKALEMDEASIKDKSISEVKQLLYENGLEPMEWFETEIDRQSKREMDYLTSELDRLEKDEEDTSKVYKEFSKLHSDRKWFKLESTETELGSIEIELHEAEVVFEEQDFFTLSDLLGYEDFIKIWSGHHASATTESFQLVQENLQDAYLGFHDRREWELDMQEQQEIQKGISDGTLPSVFPPPESPDGQLSLNQLFWVGIIIGAILIFLL